MTDIKRRENIVWIDVLRVLACFLVVFAHCCDPFVAYFDSNYPAFLQGCAIGSMVRCCVPLFVMMTGVLVIPNDMRMGDFYRKRVGRLAVPLLFWSLITPLLYFVYINYIHQSGSMSLDLASFSAEATINKLYTFIFNFNYDTTPFWYLYMLVGLYLIMPVLNAWLKSAERKEVKLFLKVWGVSLLLPMANIVAPLLGYTGNYGNMGLWGVCDWNAFGTFYYVSGFIGYVVLAHYLVRYPLEWSWGRIAAIGIPMFLVGYAITFGGYLKMQELYPGNYAYLEIMWLFTGINVFMMTFPVFITVQKIRFAPSVFIASLARLTFGIYLCHFFVVQMMYDLYATLLPDIPYVCRMVLMAMSVFTVSAFVVWVISRIPILRKVIA